MVKRHWAWQTRQMKGWNWTWVDGSDDKPGYFEGDIPEDICEKTRETEKEGTLTGTVRVYPTHAFIYFADSTWLSGDMSLEREHMAKVKAWHFFEQTEYWLGAAYRSVLLRIARLNIKDE